MITQGVITAVLLGTVVTGVIPAIGGIALLAMKKIKASSFWAGVLAYIIAMIVFAISSLLLLGAIADSPIASGIANITMAVCMALSMSVCVAACMKTRTFVGALSCGLGFGAGYLITTAIGLVGFYINFVNINSGAFDAQMSMLVNSGMYSKEDVNLAKEQFVNFTVSDAICEMISAVAFAALLAAAAVFIMRSVCAKSTFTGIAASVLTLGAGMASTVIPNAVAAVIVMAAIGAAALIFAVRMREKVVPPEKPEVKDSFMDSVSKAQNDE